MNKKIHWKKISSETKSVWAGETESFPHGATQTPTVAWRTGKKAKRLRHTHTISCFKKQMELTEHNSRSAARGCDTNPIRCFTHKKKRKHAKRLFLHTIAQEYRM